MENVVALPDRPSKRQYQWTDLDVQRLDKLLAMQPNKVEAEILRDAVCHYLSTLERDERPWMTVPSEREKPGQRRHKRPDHAA
jgi:hypothetical protein